MRKPGLIKIIQWLIKITIRSQIPPLPRIAASEYQRLEPDSARIMARYGIRSPSGLNSAMKKYKVDDVDSLARLLRHHEAKRKIQFRLKTGIRRLSGGTRQNPHTVEIRSATGGNTTNEQMLKQRIKNLRTFHTGASCRNSPR